MIAIRCVRVVVGVALAACTLTGCGYALAGRSNSLPGYIKSIGVPEFINQSTTPDIDRVLTEAVRQEFQSKGRYQVQPEAAGVDAVLTGTVTSVVLMPVQFTADRQVSSYSIIVTANVERNVPKVAHVITNRRPQSVAPNRSTSLATARK